LVVGIGDHGGGGHRFTLAGERFVGWVAEDIAQVGDGLGTLSSLRFGAKNGTVVDVHVVVVLGRDVEPAPLAVTLGP
jgi:hypothetical protein